MVSALSEFLAEVAALGETNCVEVVQTEIERKLVCQFVTPLWQPNNQAPQLVQLLGIGAHLDTLPRVETLPCTQNAHPLSSSARVYKRSHICLFVSGEFL